MLVEAGRRGLAHIEFLQVESVLPFPYVVFGYNVGAAFQGKVACGPFIFRRFFQPVFNDLGASFSGGAYIEVIIYAGIGRVGSRDQRRGSVSLLLTDAGGQMEGADAKLSGNIAKSLGITLAFGVARNSAGHKGSAQDALDGAFFVVGVVIAQQFKLENIVFR